MIGIIGGPIGIGVGAALGSLLGGKQGLSEALREALEERDLKFVSLRRYGPRTATLVYARKNDFDMVRSEAPMSVRAARVEDWIYGDMLNQLKKRGVRLAP